MHRLVYTAAIAAILMIAGRAVAQPSVTFNFADGTDDGWSTGFGTADAGYAIASVGGANYMVVPESNGFQAAGFASGDTSSAFFMAMQAAAANPAGYQVTYNYEVNTAGLTANPSSSFLQLGSYVNGGDGTYDQDFGTTKEAQFSGSQLASGGILTGSVSVPFSVYATAAGFASETFYRFGLIINGNVTGQTVGYTAISISPVPEPASLSLLGLGASALVMRRRRSA